MRFMLDPLGDHNHFPGLQPHRAITKSDGHLTLDNNEDFIRIRMVVPYKIAFEFDELEMIIVHPGNNFGCPLLGKP